MFVGVDTHKKTHVLVAIDTEGRTHGSRTVANTPEGWAAALQWVRGQQQQQVRWGVENSGSLGKGFAQFLLHTSSAPPGSPVKLVLRVDFAPKVGRSSRNQREIGAEQPNPRRYRLRPAQPG